MDLKPFMRQARYAASHSVIWTISGLWIFEYHSLRALAMFDVTSFPTFLSGNGRHFKFCRYGIYVVEHVEVHVFWNAKYDKFVSSKILFTCNLTTTYKRALYRSAWSSRPNTGSVGSPPQLSPMSKTKLS